MLRSFWNWIQANADNKLLIAILSAVLGAILTKYVPALGTLLHLMGKRVVRLFHRRSAYIELQDRYLDWVVTELRELKLSGIVSYDDSKKPQLEQVFVSLRLGYDQRDETEATIDHLWTRLCELAQLPPEADTIYFPREILRELPPNLRLKLEQHAASLRHLMEITRKGLAVLLTDAEPVSQTEWSTLLQALSKVSAARTSNDGTSQLQTLIRTENRIAILGPPGAGKTTFLQYIALAYARERAGDRKLRQRGTLQLRLGTRNWRLPIFIPLASVSAHLVEPVNGRDPSLLDIIPRILPPDLQSEEAVSAFFTSAAENGKCIFLFDGLDEVATDDEFRAVVRALESLALRYPENKFVITSRIAGWRTGVGADFRVLHVNDLSQEEIRNFIDLWYSAVELNSVIGPLENESPAERQSRERRVSKKSKELKLALDNNPGIQQMASNPMLLSIICLVHRSLATLPRERSKLYLECSKIFLEQWDISRGIRVDDTNLRLEQKEYILRTIAFSAHIGAIGGDHNGGREFDRASVERAVAKILPGMGQSSENAGRLLQRLIERSGILVERRRNVLAFSHLTFQEYFTARHIAADDAYNSGELLLSEDRLTADWWREVILLYIGLIGDATKFLRGITSGSDDLCRRKLRLAVHALSDAVEVRDASVRRSILEEAASILTVSTTSLPFEVVKPPLSDAVIRRSRTEEWYSAAARHSDLVAKDGVEISRLVYAALQIPVVGVRVAALSILRSSNKILLSRELANEIVRLAGVGESDIRAAALQTLPSVYSFLEPKNVESTLLVASVDSDRTIRDRAYGAAAQAVKMGWDLRLAVPKDRQLLSPRDSGAITYISERILSVESVAEMVEILLDVTGASFGLFEYETSFFTSDIFSSTRGEKLALLIVEAIQTGELSPSIAARFHLLRLWGNIQLNSPNFTVIVRFLLACLKKPELVDDSSIALAKIASAGFLQGYYTELQSALSGDDPEICDAVLKLLARCGPSRGLDSAFVPQILPMLQSTRWDLRRLAAEALTISVRSKYEDDILLALLPLVNDRSEEVRVAAITTLGQVVRRKRNGEAMAELVRPLWSQWPSEVGVAAVTALARLAERGLIRISEIETELGLKKLEQVLTRSLSIKRLMWFWRRRNATSMAAVFAMHDLLRSGFRYARSPQLADYLIRMLGVRAAVHSTDFFVYSILNDVAAVWPSSVLFPLFDRLYNSMSMVLLDRSYLGPAKAVAALPLHLRGELILSAFKTPANPARRAAILVALKEPDTWVGLTPLPLQRQHRTPTDSQVPEILDHVLALLGSDDETVFELAWEAVTEGAAFALKR